MVNFTEEIIDNLCNMIVNKNINNINKLSLGFLTEDESCKVNIANIVLHTAENLPIFNEQQRENIINLYNSVTYV